MKNKIILDNIIFNLQKIGGVSNYWFNLLKKSLKNKNIFYYENRYYNKNNYRNLIKLPNEYLVKDKSKMPMKIRRYLPLKGMDKYFNIFHSSYYRYATGNIKNITTVHDFMYEKYLSKHNFKRIIHSAQKYFAIKHSDYIIGVSKNSLDDLILYFPEFKNKKMRVIYHGINNDFYSIKNKNKWIKINNYKLYYNSYFFYFGNRSSYKNFKLLVDAYSALLKNNKNKNIPDLVVAGGGDFSKEEKILLKEKNILLNTVKLPQQELGASFDYKRKTNLSPSGCRYISRQESGDVCGLIKFNKITNKELNILYNYCTGFIYPSLYEGFGMPVIESMRAGAPVICSNSSSIPEVAGKAAILINPHNILELENALNSLLDNNARKDMIKLGYKQAKNFSWDKAYKETLEIYNSI